MLPENSLGQKMLNDSLIERKKRKEKKESSNVRSRFHSRSVFVPGTGLACGESQSGVSEMKTISA